LLMPAAIAVLPVASSVETMNNATTPHLRLDFGKFVNLL